MTLIITLLYNNVKLLNIGPYILQNACQNVLTMLNITYAI